ncbi:hypothetical protein BN7874_265 [Phage NCTB]|jgi:DNA-binding transcriptional ArsR family regulator|nr:hypothetical protein BN7874_265 [Phage NCTB]
MSAEISKIRKILKSDTRYKRLKSTFDTSDLFQLPFDDLKDELKTLHRMRKIHKLKVGHPNFVQHLSEAAIRDTTNRHRYSEILVSCTEANTSLAKMIESFESYFLIKYAHELKPLRTKEERKNFIKAVMDKMHRYLDDTDELIKITRILIEDIDKASFTVKHLVDAFTIISKRDHVNIN